MLKTKTLILLLIFSFLSINAQRTGLEIRKLKGSIKKVENYISDNWLSSVDFYSEKGMLEKEISYNYDFATDTKKLLSIDSTLYTFNNNNKLIKELRFDKKGIDTTAYFYNNKGLLIKEIHTIQGNHKPWVKEYSYNKSDKITIVYETGRGRTNREITEYDTKERKTKVIFQYGDDDDLSKPNYIGLYNYNNEKNIVTYYKYSPRYKDNYLDKKIFKYDKNKNLIEKVLYKPQRLFDVIRTYDDTLITSPKEPMTVVKYTYDENEALTSFKVYNDKKQVVSQENNEYDKQKRLIKKVQKKNKETFIEITKYDISDNIVEFAAYKKTLKSKPIYFRAHTFNKKGQETKETYFVDGDKIIKKNYYDKFGNIKKSVHLKKGKVILTNHIRKYDYYKNNQK